MRIPAVFILPFLLSALHAAAEEAPSPPAFELVLFAGKKTAGFSGDGGPANAAELYEPSDVAVDAAGNLFICDFGNNRVRRVDARTRIISTVAGNGKPGFAGDGGKATDAMLHDPVGVAVDPKGNLFIADSRNNRIRKVDFESGTISTIAGDGFGGGTAGKTGRFSGDGGPATAASFYFPTGVAIDGHGRLFVADYYNNRIRKIDAASIISTVAGDGFENAVGGRFTGDGGAATTASLNRPSRVAVDSAGNILIADEQNHRIRKVDAATGIIVTFAGNGKRGTPQLNAEKKPTGVLAPSGDGMKATLSSLYAPSAVAADKQGNVYFNDMGLDRIRKVDKKGVIRTIAGGGVWDNLPIKKAPTQELLAEAVAVAVDHQGNVYIAERGAHWVSVVRRAVPAASDR